MMSLKHHLMSESKEVLKIKIEKDGTCQKHTETKLKVLPRSKLEQFEQQDSDGIRL